MKHLSLLFRRAKGNLPALDGIALVTIRALAGMPVC
jgi:hypothetical protein